MPAPGEIVLSGWFKAVDDGRLSRANMNKICRVEMYNSVKMYMLDRSNDGFGLRFKPEGFSMLGLYQRSSAYQERQNRVYGRTIPYFSPPSKKRRMSMSEHMATILRVEGTGYNIRTTSTAESIKVKLTLPGARKLNQGKIRNYHDYASQLIGWNAVAKWQAVKVMQRAVDGIEQQIIRHATQSVVYGA
jgi:hypothetical protein